VLENKFFLLFINFLWMAGLLGALFTLIYMVQYRRKHWWNIGYTYNVPRLLAPLYGSLLIFVAGLSLHAYVAQRSISLWVALVWGVLAFFFLFRLLDVIFAALQSGWDSVLAPPQAEEGGRPGLPIWSSSVIVLLLANLLLLGWWGTVQLNAGALDLSWLERGRATGKSTPKITPTALGQPATPTKNDPPAAQAGAATPTLRAALAVTGTMAPVSSTLLLTGTVIPVISTLDANDLQVTPTPAGALPEETTVPPVASAPVVTATAASALAAMPTLTPTASSTLTVTPLAAITTPIRPTLTPIPTPTVASRLTPTAIATTPISTTPVVTPTVATTPVATSPAGPLVTVQSATGANVHATPNVAANIVWLLANATTAPVLGRTADQQWFLVRLSNGAQGWVNRGDIGFQGEIERVPVVTSQ